MNSEAKDELAIELCNTISARVYGLKLFDGLEVLAQAVARLIVGTCPSEETARSLAERFGEPLPKIVDLLIEDGAGLGTMTYPIN
jgi:hypothetical protein